jgi:hypothetical protein
MKAMIAWITAWAVVSAIFVSIYLVVQQGERLGANDPVERLASQVAANLATGQPEPQAQPIDLSRSLASFWVVYDASNTPVAGSGFLNGALATVPPGVLDAARESGHNSVSWQPEEGLRFATAAFAVGDSVVLAGQSLRPSEERTAELAVVVGAGWLGTTVVLALGCAVYLLAGGTAGLRRR